MSGSSYAERRYTRCIVGLNAGISISWAPDPDGSYEHGARHHRDEEARFRERLDAAAPQIEVICDELEATGRTFTAPDAAAFAQAQRAEAGMVPIASVRVHCTPPLSQAELDALMGRVAAAVAEPPPPPPSERAPEPEPAAVAGPPRPWWKVW